MAILKFVSILLALLPVVLCDTPANCTFEDVVGQWEFRVSAGGEDNTLNCTKPG